MKLLDFVTTLQKAGARHGKFDREALQKAHDALADLVDKSHCGQPTDIQKEDMGVQMANARHSRKDLERIKSAHDLCKEAGAACGTAQPALKAGGGNPNHDDHGRFATGDGGGSSGSKDDPHPATGAERASINALTSRGYEEAGGGNNFTMYTLPAEDGGTAPHYVNVYGNGNWEVHAKGSSGEPKDAEARGKGHTSLARFLGSR